MTINIFSFWKYQEVISYTNKAALYGNGHNLAIKLPNISLFIKYIIEKSFFYKQFDQTKLQSNFLQLAFSNFITDGTICLTTRLKLDRYVYATYGN